MNKKRKFLSFVIILTLIFALFPSTAEAASKVKINKTKTTIYVGKTETLKISGTNKTVKWTTSNKNVATVSRKGKVTAKKTGTATITAKVSGKKYNCKVTVKKPYINCSSKTLYVSDTYTLKLTGTSIKSIKSSNTKVATVSNKGKVTAKKAGTATITITGKDKKTYKCKITVKKKEHKHSYTKKVIKPTCTEKGYTLYTCSCGDSYKKDYKDATGHSWDDWKVTKEATETEEGLEKQSCIRCEAENTRPISKKAHEHNYEYKVIKEPTCTEDGIKILECTICGEDDGQQFTIDAHHTWGEWEITKDPGTEVHTDVFTEEIPFGEREHECNMCHEKQMQYIINIDASAYDENDIYTVSGVTFISENIAQVYGTFHDDMAYETLAMVNNLRKSLGKTELKWNNGFRNMGKIRSAEISVRLSHTRPSGMFVIPAENIAFSGGVHNAQQAFDGWYNSPGHYQNMINDYNNNLYYASCFENEYGGYFWVQLFY